MSLFICMYVLYVHLHMHLQCNMHMGPEASNCNNDYYTEYIFIIDEDVQYALYS